MTFQQYSDHEIFPQVHPSVSRLCAPIEGTDEARLADCLGLDTTKYSHLVQPDTKEVSLFSTTGFMDDDDNFKVTHSSPRIQNQNPVIFYRLQHGAKHLQFIWDICDSCFFRCT